jgi:tRNA1(Val) A37 N6-methylase TrmN6
MLDPRDRTLCTLCERADAMAVTEDRLLDGRVRLRQPARGYRAAVDPVLLAAAVAPSPGEMVVDLGCGAGAALLCLAARLADCRLIGLDADPDIAMLAQANILANGFEGRAAVVAADIRRLPLAPGSADRVMVNPPFLKAGAARPSPIAERAAANREAAAVLTDWLEAARRLLGPRGWLTLIHRADRLDDVIAGLAPGFGAIAVRPVRPGRGRTATRILVRARKDARSPASLTPDLVLHEPSGAFTPAAEAVLRRAAPIGFDDERPSHA